MIENALRRKGKKLSRRDFLKSVGVVTILGSGALFGMKAKSAGSATGEKYGGTYILASHVDNTHLTPFYPGITADETVQINVHEPLYKINNRYELQPILAKSYETSEDGLTWTFHLRKGIPFHDGHEFTAEDVKYTYEWAMDPENATETHSNFEAVDKVEVVDDYTINVITKYPYAPFMIKVARHGIVPKHYHEKMTPEEYNLHPMGTGPYEFKEWVPGDHLTLEAFDDYWQGRPYIDYFKMVIIPEPSSRAIALRTGEVHSSAWPLNPEDTLKIMEDPNFTSYSSPDIAINHYQMNQLNPFLQDKRVRQAMMYALDRDSTVENIMKGLATKAHTYMSPALPWYEQAIKKYDYDPEKAKQLLAKAGLKPGPDGIMVNEKGERFEITCLVLMGDELRGTQAEMDSQLLRQVGIDMKLERQEVGTFVGRVFRPGEWEYDLAIYNWTYTELVDPDPSPRLACDGVNNYTNWCNKEADELMKKGLRELDPEKRQVIYSKLQKIFAEEVPFLYIQFWDEVNFMAKKLNNLPDPDKVTYSTRVFQEIKDLWLG